jgi:hypothetical protein
MTSILRGRDRLSAAMVVIVFTRASRAVGMKIDLPIACRIVIAR